MNEDRFKALFSRYLDDSLPPEDIRELQSAMHDDRYASLLDELLKNAYQEPPFAEVDMEARKTVFDAISRRIKQDKRRFIPVRRLTGVAAVAAVVLLAIGVGWFYLQPHDHKQIEPVYSSAEITPSTNKATLTLANGKKVILTDELHGQLAEEAGVKVSKTTQGQIVYTVGTHGDKGQTAFEYNTLTTARGEQYQVILPDGTHVWLDATSSLRYPVSFNGKERRVELTGQGYFEVSVHPSQQFIVKTKGSEVQVLGTHFNVSAYEDDQNSRITLLEGAVRVSGGQGAVLLKPGEQAVVNDKGQLTLNKDADVGAAVAWKNGSFAFDDADTRAIMRQISRWYDIQIRYEGEPTPTLYSGKMERALSLTQVLAGLSKSGIHVKLEGKVLTVMP